jgi:purine nucleosidase
VVDWERRQGWPDNAAILMHYDQPRFESMVQAALAVP